MDIISYIICNLQNCNEGSFCGKEDCVFINWPMLVSVRCPPPPNGSTDPLTNPIYRRQFFTEYIHMSFWCGGLKEKCLTMTLIWLNIYKEPTLTSEPPMSDSFQFQ